MNTLDRSRLTRIAGCFLLLSPGHAQPSPLASITGSLAKDRARAEDSVAVIQGRYSKNSKQYMTGQMLYNEAHAKYQGWVAQVRTAILEGSLNQMVTDKAYQDDCNNAKAAGEKFDVFFRSLGPQPRNPALLAVLTALGPTLGSLLEKALEGWVTNGKQRDEMRLKMAEQFVQDVSWKTWETIYAARKNP